MNALRAARALPLKQDLPALLIWGTLLFNCALAFVNARGIGISQTPVAVCEVLLMGAAIVVIARRGLLRDQLIILCVYALCFVFTLFRFAYAQDIELKPPRDLAIIFVFLCLGLSSRVEPYRLVFYASIVVTIVGAIEMMLPQLFGTLFNIKAYYINSRGFAESAFWNTESDLFVSGTRPDSRFFLAFTGWPRASSIFLEPVSLGNFIIVSLMVLLAGWPKLPQVMRSVWALTLIMLLLLSDSRFAFACGLILIGLSLVLRRLPQQFSFMLFGIVVAGAGILVWVTGISVASDDFLGRLFYTFSAMRALDLPMLLGVKYSLAEHFMDSGLVYFIVSQSLLVVILLPLLYSTSVIVVSPEARLYKHYLMIMLALSLLISNSLFSIKVAALLWFCLGAFRSAAVRSTVRAPSIVSENVAQAA
jgi:putative polymerase